MSNDLKFFTAINAVFTGLNLGTLIVIILLAWPRAESPLPDCEPRTHRDEVQIGCRQTSTGE